MTQDSSAGTPAHVGQRPGEPPGSGYMTIAELARWLKIGRGSAWSLVIERGEIPYVRIADRTIRIARSDVEHYLRRCRSDAPG